MVVVDGQEEKNGEKEADRLRLYRSHCRVGRGRTESSRTGVGDIAENDHPRAVAQARASEAS